MRRLRSASFVLACLAAVSLSACGSQPEAPVAPAAGDAPADQAADAPESTDPVVEIKTNYGVVRVRLFKDQAPLTVANFLDYVERGHYDGTVFHQVEQGYVILGGSFTSEYSERPGEYPVRNEAHNGLHNRRGTLAMARQADVIDSATCQFFINLGDNEELDHQGSEAASYGYCVFGEVVAGMDVIDAIAGVSVEDTDEFYRRPVETVLVESARRLR